MYLRLYCLDFSFQFKLCNLDQNPLFNELNKKYYYWGSFGTLQFYIIVWTISSNIKWKKIVRVINNITWLYLYLFNILNLVQSLSFLFTIAMRPISADQHFLAVSLLNKEYSQHWIQTRTDLGKVTVGRINNEVERKKENHSGGCPSKLSTHDNHTILCQITTGKLNNAVQATKFINSIIPDLFLSQTVRKILKEAGLHSTTKKFLCWRLAIGNKCSSLQISWKLDCEGLEEGFMKWWN